MIEKLFIATTKGSVLQACTAIELKAGMGIVGDRNFGAKRYPGQNLTLIEAEEIERFCMQTGRAIDLSLTRRNLVTRGVRLNGLVGQEFMIGEVRLRGVELCEPCASLGKLLANAGDSPADVVRYWVGRGGLRADVLSDGNIAVGDAIRPALPSEGLATK